ncbi:hypothetical protein BHE74_00011620 [Ensete ventricosum]|nr:hypothetical protein BHE74_00011620 [Ensete ventricosum]
MGKSQDEHPAPAPHIFPPDGHEGNACDGCSRCRSIGRIARPRCVTTLVLAVAILLLVVFWLPPFVRRYEGAGRPDPDPRFSGEVVGWLDLGLLFPAISLPSPDPSPQPNHHLHHHHHHHKHHFPAYNAPGPAPPDTAPQHGYEISPSGCGCGFSSKPKGKGYSAPAAVPVDAPKHSAAPAAVLGCSYRPVGAPMSAQNPILAPRAHGNPPVPAPSRISASPSPAVPFMHVPPRSKSVKDNEPPDRTPSISPASYSCESHKYGS